MTAICATGSRSSARTAVPARDARRLAENWERLAAPEGKRAARETADDLSRTGAILALAYPDRVAQARPGKRGEYLLANGRGGRLEAADSLGQESYLAVA